MRVNEISLSNYHLIIRVVLAPCLPLINKAIKHCLDCA